jgi:glycine dehydrogenase subunit 1
MNYIPNTLQDQQKMLQTVGQSSTEDLFRDIPQNGRLAKELSLPTPLSEPELLAELKKSSEKNAVTARFLGAGSYNHFIPSAVKHIISRSEFYTAYTPYQAEVSQGGLQAIYEFQSLLCELTGMDVANASMYDGATALVEAAFLACRVTGRKEIAVSAAVHPEYRKVLKTYTDGADLKVMELPYNKEGRTVDDLKLTEQTACVLLQQPNFFGCLEKVDGRAAAIHANQSLFIVSADPISLGILSAPGSYGADVVVGEGQALGNPQSFGGPALGLFAAKKEYLRQIPGRVVGKTTDLDGQTGYCLTLQTREQHIRRERATSNICSNEALAALAAGAYLSIMGKAGLRKAAELCLQKANYLKKKLEKRSVFPSPTFKEFVIKSEKPVGLSLDRFYPELKGCRLICVTELTPKEALDQLISAL